MIFLSHNIRYFTVLHFWFTHSRCTHSPTHRTTTTSYW